MQSEQNVQPERTDEHTQAANYTLSPYYNPYGELSPKPLEKTLKTDAYGIPAIPPAPPFKRNWWKIIAIIEAIAIISSVIALSSYIIVQKMPVTGKANKEIASTSVSSVVPRPTPTQQPIATYTAITLVNAFIANISHTGATYAQANDNWKCCSYFPNRGAYRWCDSCLDGPGAAYYVDIAVFDTNLQATTDESELANNGYSTNVVNDCLLSYDIELAGAFTTDQYIQIMRSVCTH